MKTLLVLLLLGTSTSTAQAQFCTIESEIGTGKGVVVGRVKEHEKGGYVGLVLTAKHVITDEDDFPVTGISTTYENGSKSTGCTVVQRYDDDIAIVRAWVPDSITPVDFSDSVAEGQPITIHGLYDRDTEVSRLFQAHLYADCDLYPGDSGCAVTDSNGRLVGIISGGWFWLSDRKNEQLNKTPTWPMRAVCSSIAVQRVREIIEAGK